jgi:arylsulfatase A-like enzyme
MDKTQPLTRTLAAVVVMATIAVAEPPNYLIVMVDDLGYGDISCHGGATPTPSIDTLFHQGVELGTFMTWSVCSPSRAGLLTGKNPLRLNQGPNTDGQLSPNTHTLGDAFQKHGYRTGIFGKWHNGTAPKFLTGAPYVNDFGFDRWVGFHGGGIDYFTKVWPNTPTEPCWYHDRKEVNDERDYATDLLTRHATEFMTRSTAEEKKFVCYLPYNAIHTPLHVLEKDLSRVPPPIVKAAGGLRPWKEYYKLTNDMRFGGRLSQAYRELTGDTTLDAITGKLSDADRRVLYSALLINLDDNISRLLRYLDRNDLADNTVVWFFSDNGATPVGRNLPFKGGKHSIWEGGIHSPAVVRWPAGKLVGPRRYDGLLGYLDVYPTCMQMAGFHVPDAADLDGKACYHALRDNRASPTLAYHYLYRDQDMIRTARWKLFRNTGGCALYDLDQDIGETTDVADHHADVVRSLSEQLTRWLGTYSVAPTHVANHPGHAAPSGDVLEVSFTATGALRGPHPARIVLAPPLGVRTETGDRLEFDIKMAPGSEMAGFHVSPIFRTTSLLLTRKAVDDRSRRVNRTYAPADRPNQWERRSVGLAAFAPMPLAPACIAVTAGKAGAYRFYLDNIVVRRRGGAVKVYWNEGKPNLRRAPPPIQDLTIRVTQLR